MDALCSTVRAGGISIRRASGIGLISLALLLSPYGVPLGLRFTQIVHHGFVVEREARLAYQSELDEEQYGRIARNVDFLADASRPEQQVYVLGSPSYYYLAGRDPAFPLLATWFWPLAEMWQQLADSLERAPPDFIYFEDGAFGWIRGATTEDIEEHLERVGQLIESAYEPVHLAEGGKWYARKK